MLIHICTWVAFASAMFWSYAMLVQLACMIGNCMLKNSYTIHVGQSFWPAISWAVFGFLYTL